MYAFKSDVTKNMISFIIFFLNSLWIHYLNSEFNMNRLSFSWIHYESIIFFVNELSINYVSFICIANSLWVHYLFANSLEIPDLFCQFTTGILSYSRFRYFFGKITVIHYFFRAIHHISYEMLLASSLWINYLFREY